MAQSTQMGSCRARSVYLTTLTGQATKWLKVSTARKAGS